MGHGEPFTAGRERFLPPRSRERRIGKGSHEYFWAQVSVQGADANLGYQAKKSARRIGRLALLDYQLCLVNVLVDVLASTRDGAGTGLLVQFETHLGEVLVSLGQNAVVVAVLVNLVAEG